MDHKNCVNVLFLGPSGIGKSTFINSFGNYLRFSDFRNVNINELIQPIPVKFQIRTLEGQEITITSGQDPNENSTLGNSGTKVPKVYTFKLNEQSPKLLRIIDTPGTDSTLGNWKDIFHFANAYEYIHSICIFLPPNITIQTYFANAGLIEIFSQLHPNLRKKFCFIFTKTEASNYFAPDTITNLRPILKDYNVPLVTKNNDVNKNVFYVDNEGFKYFMAKNQSVSFGNLVSIEESWNTSSKAVRDWLNFVMDDGRKPYSMPFSYIPVKDVRVLTEKMGYYLLDVTKLINTHLEDIKQEADLLEEQIMNDEQVLSMLNTSPPKRAKSNEDSVIEERRDKINEKKKQLLEFKKFADDYIDKHNYITEALEIFTDFLKNHKRYDNNDEYLKYVEQRLYQLKSTTIKQETNEVKFQEFQSKIKYYLEEKAKLEALYKQNYNQKSDKRIFLVLNKLCELEIHGVDILNELYQMKHELMQTRREEQGECLIDITYYKHEENLLPVTEGNHIVEQITREQIAEMLKSNKFDDALKSLMKIKTAAAKSTATNSATLKTENKQNNDDNVNETSLTEDNNDNVKEKEITISTFYDEDMKHNESWEQGGISFKELSQQQMVITKKVKTLFSDLEQEMSNSNEPISDKEKENSMEHIESLSKVCSSEISNKIEQEMSDKEKEYSIVHDENNILGEIKENVESLSKVCSTEQINKIEAGKLRRNEEASSEEQAIVDKQNETVFDSSEPVWQTHQNQNNGRTLDLNQSIPNPFSEKTTLDTSMQYQKEEEKRKQMHDINHQQSNNFTNDMNDMINNKNNIQQEGLKSYKDALTQNSKLSSDNNNTQSLKMQHLETKPKITNSNDLERNHKMQGAKSKLPTINPNKSSSNPFKHGGSINNKIDDELNKFSSSRGNNQHKPNNNPVITGGFIKPLPPPSSKKSPSKVSNSESSGWTMPYPPKETSQIPKAKNDRKPNDTKIDISGGSMYLPLQNSTNGFNDLENGVVQPITSNNDQRKRVIDTQPKANEHRSPQPIANIQNKRLQKFREKQRLQASNSNPRATRAEVVEPQMQYRNNKINDENPKSWWDKFLALLCFPCNLIFYFLRKL